MGNCCSRAGTYAPEAPLDTKQHQRKHFRTIETYSAFFTDSKSCPSSVVDQSTVSKGGRASFESNSYSERTNTLPNIRTSYDESSGAARQQYAEAGELRAGAAAVSSSKPGLKSNIACTAVAVAADGGPQQLNHDSSCTSGNGPCVGYHHTRSWCAPHSSAGGGDGDFSVGSAVTDADDALPFSPSSVRKQSSGTVSILAAQQYSTSAVSTPGLTLLINSHSNSSHQGSPRACDNSRSSSCSGHTAFASLPASVCPSGSVTPDSMMSALSTASSYISSSSSGGCVSTSGGSIGGHRDGHFFKDRSSGGGSMLAAAVKAAAAATAAGQGMFAAVQQQQQAEGQLQQQLTGSVYQLTLESEDGGGASATSKLSNTSSSSSSGAPTLRQQQQHVSFQGVDAERDSPVHQRSVLRSPLGAACEQEEVRFGWCCLFCLTFVAIHSWHSF